MTPTPVITRFRDWLRQERNLRFADYEAMHRWSVDDLPAFWGAVWAFEDIVSPTPFASVLGDSRMPGAEWFAGAQVNYARQVFRHCEAAHADGQPAIVAEDETGPIETIDWPTLRRRVYSLALELRALGANRGDRIAAYLPNRPEAVIAFLACASIGAIWTVCAPDMGAPAVLDRFRQIEPRFLIATDGCRYAGRVHDRAEVVRTLSRELPTVEHLIVVASGTTATDIPGARPFAAAVVRTDAEIAGFEPEWLPFDHPLWVVYSSGTTGKPKALVHGHGGILVSCAATRLHMYLGASYGNETPGE
ncbi:MAG: AMP-binding protein, partial [Rhodospirillales bacterium]|nr:AMP-binding protein [Rhodospirillales bacterium]